MGVPIDRGLTQKVSSSHMIRAFIVEMGVPIDRGLTPAVVFTLFFMSFP